MEYHIDIDAEIGYYITKQFVRWKLKSLKGQHCDVRINSYGGDVQTALDIRQQFIDHGDVTAYIFGMTASAATILAMGAKQIKMSRYALMLIHPASMWIDEWGSMNIEELTRVIKDLNDKKDDLKTVDDAIALLYAARTGKTKDEMLALMAKADWLTAEQCLEIGLIDEIVEDGKKVQMTNKTREFMVANHIPMLPEGSYDEDLPADENKVKKFFRSLYQDFVKSTTEDSPEAPQTPITNTTNTTTNMKKEFKAVAALLALESLSLSESGSIELTNDQLEQLEKAVSDLNDKIQTLTDAKNQAEENVRTLTTEKDQLNEQVQNLLKGDGDDTHHIEDNGAEESVDDISETKNLFNTVKDLI